MTSIEIVATTTMGEIHQAYPSAKVGLFQRYHIGGCDSCGYKPTETLEQVRHNFAIQDSLVEIGNVIRGSAEVFESLHISARELTAARDAGEQLTLVDARTRAEYDSGNPAGSRLITVELTFEILDSWPKETCLVFYSNDGRRSLDKASYFRAYGFPHARSLTGGLAGWDPDLLPVREVGG